MKHINKDGLRYECASSVQHNYLDISPSTLRNWADLGRIRTQRLTEKGKRYYCVDDIKALIGDKPDAEEEVRDSDSAEEHRVIVYARVSSSSQKQDLQRQVDRLRELYPDSEIVTDIASTLNYRRKGLKYILDQALEKKFDKLVVAYKDRLDRFCFDLIKYIMQKQNIEIEVVSKPDTPEISFETRVAEDVVNVVNYFVAKYNGNKSARHKSLKDQSLSD